MVVWLLDRHTQEECGLLIRWGDKSWGLFVPMLFCLDLTSNMDTAWISI